MIALKHHPDIALGEFSALLALHGVDRCSAKPVLAGPCVIEQCEDIQQGRLPRSGRPHDSDELSLLNLEVDAAQDPGLTGSAFVAALDIV